MHGAELGKYKLKVTKHEVGYDLSSSSISTVNRLMIVTPLKITTKGHY